MTRRILYLLGIIVTVTVMGLLLLAGCGKPGSNADRSEGVTVSAPASGAADKAEAGPPSAMPRKIIYSADVSLTTDNLATAARDIEEKVKQCEGYVAGSELGGGGKESRHGTWKVRIPAEQFQAFLSSLSGVGDVVSTKISSEDVSEEFYDVAARLRNKQTEEARLLQHLKASTAQLSDILAVERELSRVREEIERIQGRLRFLTNQTDLTTVTITVRGLGIGAKSGPSFVSEIARTFGGSLKAMGNFVRGLTLVVIALLPWVLIAGGIGLPFYLRRQRRKQAASAPRTRPESPYEQ